MPDETEPDRGSDQTHDLSRCRRQGCSPTIDPERLAGEPEGHCRVARRVAGFNGRQERHDPVRRDEPRHLRREPTAHPLRAEPLVGGELAGREPAVHRSDAPIRISQMPGIARGIVRGGIVRGTVRSVAPGEVRRISQMRSIVRSIVRGEERNQIRARKPRQEMDLDQARKRIAASEQAIRDQRLEPVRQRVRARRKARIPQLEQP